MKNPRKKVYKSSESESLRICKNTFCKREFKTSQDFRFCNICRAKMRRVITPHFNPYSFSS